MKWRLKQKKWKKTSFEWVTECGKNEMPFLGKVGKNEMTFLGKVGKNEIYNINKCKNPKKILIFKWSSESDLGGVTEVFLTPKFSS